MTKRLKNCIFFLLPFFAGCIVIPYAPHARESVLPASTPPRLEVKATNIFINGKPVSAGEHVNLSSGQQIAAHDGPVSLPTGYKRTMSGAETARMLGCLALLPLCALAGQEIFPDSSTRYQQHQCTGRSDFDAKPDQIYSLEITLSIDTMPVLKILNVTDRAYLVSENVMTCNLK